MPLIGLGLVLFIASVASCGVALLSVPEGVKEAGLNVGMYILTAALSALLLGMLWALVAGLRSKKEGEGD